MQNTNFYVCNQDFIAIKSEASDQRFLYTPSLVIANDGTMVLSYDEGGQVSDLPHFEKLAYTNQKMICRISIKTNDSEKFIEVAHFAMCHARLLKVKDRIYLIGHNGKVQVTYSDDNGRTWKPNLFEITQTDGWHASACNVIEKRGRIFLVMERRTDRSIQGWNVAGLSPHVLSARMDSDLTDPEAWTVSFSYSFADLFSREGFKYFGMPFWGTGIKYPAHFFIEEEIKTSSAMGWLEGNIVNIADKDHVWYDHTGNTFYIFLRLNTAGVGYAAVLKVVSVDKGGEFQMFTELAKTPSGNEITFVPFPGGHNKFFILYDDSSELYWLCSTQSTDSMLKLERMPSKRYNLPNNERNRLVLHFSKNCIDWVFAGLVSKGNQEQCSRNYPSMCIRNNDLFIAARSGTELSKDSQYSDIITIHTIKNFRSLIY